MTPARKLMFIFGTRPEAIKMAPVIRTFKERDDLFETKICVTGQHRQMLDQVLTTFKIKPEYDFDLMNEQQSISNLMTGVMDKTTEMLKVERPDLVLVHGDTTTAAAASMSAFFMQIKVAHIEAGLRTYKMKSPFPEEFNRQLISKIAEHHFAPTEENKLNLLREGVEENKIVVTGNTVVDALNQAFEFCVSDNETNNKLVTRLKDLLQFDFLKTRFVLITTHRRENFGSPLLEICDAVKELANLYNNVNFVWPVHLNPTIRQPVQETLSKVANIRLTSPLTYQDFVLLLAHCHFVMTDSGGIQEEAPSFHKPILVMRNETERPEAVQNGIARLIGSTKGDILDGASNLLNNQAAYTDMASKQNPFGDGNASKRIFDSLSKNLNK